eukprot:4009777-Pleurochrysis_carterae.AAC.2
MEAPVVEALLLEARYPHIGSSSTNAVSFRTAKVYEDEASVPRNTAVLVRRVPPRRLAPLESVRGGNAMERTLSLGSEPEDDLLDALAGGGVIAAQARPAAPQGYNWEMGF